MSSEDVGKAAATEGAAVGTTMTAADAAEGTPGAPITTAPAEAIQQYPPNFNYTGRGGYGQGPRRYYNQGRGGGRGGYRSPGVYNGNVVGVVSAGPKTCYNCGESGHIARDCTNQRLEGQSRDVITKAKSQYRRCFNCGKMGHMSADCTIPSGNKACYQCGQEGHIAKECPNQPQEEEAK